MTDHPFSPMLVQYLVALCCLKWDPTAVDVTVGDMVTDTAAQKTRDVDVTVTVTENGSVTRAFKAYEVKRERQPLDVVTVEQLCLKLLDMPQVTHRAIVSASGFTDGAKAKAARHCVELYVLQPWTRPLKDQFPLFTMEGTVQECFQGSKSLLCWADAQLSIAAPTATQTFQVQPEDALFTAKGKAHSRYKNFEDYRLAMLLRSTGVLFTLEPAQTIWRTFPIPFVGPDDQIPCGPAWPHTHTLDVASDGVFVETGSGKCRIDAVTISGHLQWQREKNAFHYYVIERVPDGEVFAGALVSPDHQPGHMTSMIFSPKTREIGIEFVRLSEKHLRAIRDLKLRTQGDQS
jgi:hypothetical protein